MKHLMTEGHQKGHHGPSKSQLCKEKSLKNGLLFLFQDFGFRVQCPKAHEKTLQKFSFLKGIKPKVSQRKLQNFKQDQEAFPRNKSHEVS
jgi:hypothetical protein